VAQPAHGRHLAEHVLKSAYEAIMTPVTYLVVGKLKEAEGIDVYDRDTDFSPVAVGG
jgi:hypothetical protein